MHHLFGAAGRLRVWWRHSRAPASWPTPTCSTGLIMVRSCLSRSRQFSGRRRRCPPPPPPEALLASLVLPRLPQASVGMQATTSGSFGLRRARCTFTSSTPGACHAIKEMMRPLSELPACHIFDELVPVRRDETLAAVMRFGERRGQAACHGTKEMTQPCLSYV